LLEEEKVVNVPAQGVSIYKQIFLGTA